MKVVSFFFLALLALASAEMASGETGSGDSATSDKLSAGAIAGIVVGALLAVGGIVAGLLVWFMSSGSPASNPAALAGTGASFGKRIPSLVISAEALAGKV